MSSTFFHLAVGSRDLSQAEKKMTLCKAEQIDNLITFLTQNDNFLHWHSNFELSFCEFHQLCKLLFLSQLEINPVIQQPNEEN